MRHLSIFIAAALFITGPAELGLDAARCADEPDAAYKQVDINKARARKLYFDGMALINHQKYDKAIANFREALKLDPGNYSTYLMLGKVYTRVNMHDDSINAFRDAIAAEPSNPQAYDLLMQLYLYLKKPDMAVEAAEVAMKAGVAPAALPDLGWTYYQAGRLDDAEANYKKTLETGGESYGPLRNLGILYHARGDYEKAAEYYEKAEKLDPENVTLPYLKALTYDKLGKEDDVWREVKLFKKRDRNHMANIPKHNKQYFPNTDPGNVTRYIFLLKDAPVEKKDGKGAAGEGEAVPEKPGEGAGPPEGGK